MQEKYIEQKLLTEVKEKGGLALKLVTPGYDGMPDRMILFPKGRITFAELKAPGKKPRELQLSRHRMLRSLGFKVYVIDDVKQIGVIIDEIQAT
ncbi:MAG: VRR-NUC domain-containing protein [Oscillospiraceae bacterium]